MVCTTSCSRVTKGCRACSKCMACSWGSKKRSRPELLCKECKEAWINPKITDICTHCETPNPRRCNFGKCRRCLHCMRHLSKWLPQNCVKCRVERPVSSDDEEDDTES